MIRREFLTAEEAAQMLGVAVTIIRKLARAGEIPGYKTENAQRTIHPLGVYDVL